MVLDLDDLNLGESGLPYALLRRLNTFLSQADWTLSFFGKRTVISLLIWSQPAVSQASYVLIFTCSRRNQRQSPLRCFALGRLEPIIADHAFLQSAPAKSPDFGTAQRHVCAHDLEGRF